VPDAKILKSHFDIDRAARTLARQVRAKDFSEVNANVFDRLYVARAKDAAARGDASAAEVLAEARRFVELLALPSTTANDAALARVIERTPASELTAERVVLAWQRPAVRTKLVAALDVPVNARSLGGRIEQVERTAERMSLSVDGFAGAAVIAALEGSVDWVDACFAESADQLREIVRGIVRDGAAEHVARRYLALTDGASIVAFLAAVRRLPLDRAAAIRAAVTSATASDAGDVRRKSLARWMQSTRKRRSRAIERG